VYCTMGGALESVNWNFQPFGLVDIISIAGDSVQLVVSSADPVTVTASVTMIDGSECEAQITFPELPSGMAEHHPPFMEPLLLYPNPAGDRLVVVNTSHVVPCLAVLTSAAGKRVREWVWPASEAERELDVSSVPPGAYLLHLEGENQVQRARVLIQR